MFNLNCVTLKLLRNGERDMESNPEWERGQLLRNRCLVVYEKFDMAWCLSGDVGNYKKLHSTRFEEVKAVDP